MSDFFSTKNERLPRWFRAIRWNENWARWIENQKRMFALGWLPMAFWYWYVSDDLTAQEILRLRPQTPEELAEIKKKHSTNSFHRDYDLDMYRYEMAPNYDMWERRMKYPEHYAGRYEGYRRYDSYRLPFSKDKPIFEN